MVILTGRQYSNAERKRFHQAIEELNAKVTKTKMYKTVSKKIQDEMDTTSSTIKNLRTKKVSYGEIVVAVYISNETQKSLEDILSVKEEGQSWENIMSIFDLSISDVTTTLKEIEKELIVKKDTQPKRRRRATDRYVQ